MRTQFIVQESDISRRNEFYDLEDDENILLPIPLDKPNNSILKDYNLGYWNKFVI